MLSSGLQAYAGRQNTEKIIKKLKASLGCIPKLLQQVKQSCATYFAACYFPPSHNGLDSYLSAESCICLYASIMLWQAPPYSLQVFTEVSKTGNAELQPRTLGEQCFPPGPFSPFSLTHLALEADSFISGFCCIWAALREDWQSGLWSFWHLCVYCPCSSVRLGNSFWATTLGVDDFKTPNRSWLFTCENCVFEGGNLGWMTEVSKFIQPGSQKAWEHWADLKCSVKCSRIPAQPASGTYTQDTCGVPVGFYWDKLTKRSNQDFTNHLF